jgi:hypothetical protein
VQYDEDDGDYDQRVDPIACAREAWTYISTEKAEQPQYYENHDDSPQHKISPFKRSFGSYMLLCLLYRLRPALAISGWLICV